MLEFEDTPPTRMSIEVPTGFVIMPIEDYNKLIAASMAAAQAIKVQRSIFSESTIDIVIDRDWLHEFAFKLLIEKYGPDAIDNYKVVPVDDLYVGNITYATRDHKEPKMP